MAGDPSSETLTFLFADLEASTRLWERMPEAMPAAMERHDAILRAAVEGADGRVVKSTGDGLMAVFRSAAAGAAASLRAQLALQDEPWGGTGPLRVRIGLHAGEAQQRDGDFFGPPVNRTARIMAAGHGGQVLLSARAADLAGRDLPDEAALRDLGDHRLKDLAEPERIFQLVHPRLHREFPPLATLSRRPNNLPTQTSEFLGREAQLGAVRDLLDAERVRLVTLTGPGGIGKSRLALQAAADRIDRFEDGVYFVDLAPARDAEAAFEAVVRALGVTATGDEGPLELLKQELRDRNLLLILDNFEQVVPAADGLVELLLRSPALKVLVTSREALRVRGEHLLDVPPLSVPHSRARSVEAVAGADAVRLFLERAREVGVGLSLTDESAAAVAEISARLDGLPLAIELAAARLTLFSLEELRDRLRSRLELLGRGSRDLPARQRTLRGTIEWSYELLGEEERALFALLSLFAPTTLEAVEQVVGRLDSLRHLDVVDVLTSLVDKSLVRSVAAEGGQRLSMLETIREYARERLEEAPEASRAARRAHAEHFAELARACREQLEGPAREETLARLEAELGNLTGAWRHWIEAGDVGRLEALLDALWVLHDDRGWYHGAVGLTNDVLGVLAAAPATPDRARDEIAVRTSLARGLLAIRGYTEEVEENYNRVLALAEEVGELPRRFPVLRGLASFHLYRGDFERSADVGRELLELARHQGDDGLEVDAHLVLGGALAFSGEMPAGLGHLDRAIALFDPDRHRPGPLRLGPSAGVVAHTASALLLWVRGRPETAGTRALAAVELAGRLDHPYTLAYALFHVGLLDLWRGEPRRAHERAAGALHVAAEHDYEVWTAVGLVLQGAALAALGRTDEGLALSQRGLSLYRGLKTPPVFWPLVLSLRAGTLASAGRPADAIPLVDEALELLGEQDFLAPEFALLRGDLLLAVGDRAAAGGHFRSAHELARELELRTPQLRAATRLAHLEAGADAAAALRDAYSTFTEGFETAALVEARALLAVAEAPIP
jgi:predicted ATPase/class 3 adenylate cyclase